MVAPRLDFVKIITKQILYSPEDWLKRKIATYQQHGVEPYLDHTFFLYAYQKGVVDQAIVASAALGFRVIEFMNTGNDVSPKQWDAWRRLAVDNGLRFYFEYHPPHNWKRPTNRNGHHLQKRYLLLQHLFWRRGPSK